MARAREDNKKEELLKAASYLFSKQGVLNTPVSQIVNKAGVAQGTFYLYFDSKEDVLNQIAAQNSDQLFQKARRVLELPKTKTVDKLVKIHNLIIQALNESIEKYGLEKSQILANIFDAVGTKFQEPVAALIKQGVKEGKFDNRHPQATALIILYSFKPFIEQTDKTLQPDAHLDFVLKGLGYKAE